MGSYVSSRVSEEEGKEVVVVAAIERGFLGAGSECIPPRAAVVTAN